MAPNVKCIMMPRLAIIDVDTNQLREGLTFDLEIM